MGVKILNHDKMFFVDTIKQVGVKIPSCVEVSITYSMRVEILHFDKMCFASTTKKI